MKTHERTHKRPRETARKKARLYQQKPEAQRYVRHEYPFNDTTGRTQEHRVIFSRREGGRVLIKINFRTLGKRWRGWGWEIYSENITAEEFRSEALMRFLAREELEKLGVVYEGDRGARLQPPPLWAAGELA